MKSVERQYQDEIDELKAERDRLRAALREVEWRGSMSFQDGSRRCIRCGASKIQGHAPGCVVGCALEEPKQ